MECIASGNSIVVAIKGQSSSELEGETVILNLQSGVYYGLKTVGAAIWKLIQEPKTIDEVRQAILSKYEVEPEQCDRDLQALLQDLQSERLIEVKHEAAA